MDHRSDTELTLQHLNRILVLVNDLTLKLISTMPQRELSVLVDQKHHDSLIAGPDIVSDTPRLTALGLSMQEPLSTPILTRHVKSETQYLNRKHSLSVEYANNSGTSTFS